MSSEFSMLKLVETDDFSAWVPPIDSLPAYKVMPLIEEQEAGRQFSAAVSLLMENLAPDVVDAFKELNVKQAIVFVTKWLQTSSED